jgi:hypothetical protein
MSVKGTHKATEENNAKEEDWDGRKLRRTIKENLCKWEVQEMEGTSDNVYRINSCTLFLNIQWVPGALSLGVKPPGREADHSPPSTYAFMACCSVKAQGQLYLYLFFTQQHMEC